MILRNITTPTFFSLITFFIASSNYNMPEKSEIQHIEWFPYDRITCSIKRICRFLYVTWQSPEKWFDLIWTIFWLSDIIFHFASVWKIAKPWWNKYNSNVLFKIVMFHVILVELQTFCFLGVIMARTVFAFTSIPLVSNPIRNIGPFHVWKLCR